jgi:hypothetical protein
MDSRSSHLLRRPWVCPARRRNLIPLALLAVLAIGAGVFAVVGFVGAPNATTITVQNATATTFGSPPGSTSFLMDLVSTLSSGATTGTLKEQHLIDFTTPDQMKVIPVGTSSKTATELQEPAISCALRAYTAMLHEETGAFDPTWGLHKSIPITLASARSSFHATTFSQVLPLC